MGVVKCNGEEVNRMRWQVYRQLPYLKQRVSAIYQNVIDGDKAWDEELREELQTIANALCDSVILFKLSPQVEKRSGQIREAVGMQEQENAGRASLLTDIFEMLEELEGCIAPKAKRCNACGSDVFFNPIPAGYEAMRKKYGFLYWNADFQLESRENYGCPVCEAYDRDRLMIAFLEEVQAENEEKLRMLQIAPSPAIERYALGREDILYESTDLMMPDVTFQADLQHMDMVEDETYDIIVCSHVLEHVENDARAMSELHRILKPEGVCLVLVPLIAGKQDTEEQWGCSEEENWRRFGQWDHSRLYGRNDFIRRLQGVGFYVNELGKEWFGEDFYWLHGFDDLSILYVATKDVRLVEPEEEAQQVKELAQLREENRLLRRALEDVNRRLVELDRVSGTNTMIFAHTLDNIGWEINDPKFRDKLWYPQIISVEDTISEIVEHRKSIARFGDGEFGIMCGVQRWRFQKKDEKLANRLKEVLQSQQDRVLIGLNEFYGEFSNWENGAANGVRMYLTPEVRKQHYALLNPHRIYGNARMSRNESWENVRNLQRIWEGKDCVFVEGFQTRMGVGNDLFNNARSITRILCPAESAFDRYEEIYNEAVKQPRDKLFLIALGPTACVLAYDLAMQGYQAVDLGHADLSYEWLIRGKRERLANKYCNEESDGNMVEEIHDAEYEAQIIADFR
ncbi:MAG: GT-D fold domain-containing protein [Acetatifactor sp.]|nr:GT-D fold domain-containing protein [Acetatifactor sp.]